MANVKTNNKTNKSVSNKINANNTKSLSANNSKQDAGSAGYYTRNIPTLVLIGIFLFFIMFQFLKYQKYKENRLRQRIDAEIRKKLYYTDDYY